MGVLCGRHHLRMAGPLRQHSMLHRLRALHVYPVTRSSMVVRNGLRPRRCELLPRGGHPPGRDGDHHDATNDDDLTALSILRRDVLPVHYGHRLPVQAVSIILHTLPLVAERRALPSHSAVDAVDKASAAQQGGVGAAR